MAHSFSDSEEKENRKHYARSYFARLFVAIILCLITAGVLYLVLGQETFITRFNELVEQIKNISIVSKG